MILVNNKPIIAIKRVTPNYMDLEVDQDHVVIKKIMTEFICVQIVKKKCFEIIICILNYFNLYLIN
jgi:hypothetical protein